MYIYIYICIHVLSIFMYVYLFIYVFMYIYLFIRKWHARCLLEAADRSQSSDRLSDRTSNVANRTRHEPKLSPEPELIKPNRFLPDIRAARSSARPPPPRR